MGDFDIMKETFTMGILHHARIPCINAIKIFYCEVWIMRSNIQGFELIWILIWIDDCEHITQVILDTISACQFDGHFQIVSVFEFIRIFNLDIQ